MACNSKLRGACAIMFPFFLIQSFHGYSQCTWDGGGGDNQWTNPANWAGDTLPTPSDAVILDNRFVSGNYTVTLPAGTTTVAVQSLTIRPTAGASIEVVVPATNLAMPALVAQGAVYGLDVQAGGVFRNASGISSGQSLMIADSLRIGNGGRYVHQTRASHAGSISSILSRAPGTETGIMEFDVPGTTGYTISVSGRVYGSLVLSATAAGGTRSYSSSGSSVFQVRGGFRINNGVSYSLRLNANMMIDRDLVVDSAIFNISPGGDSTVVQIRKGCYVTGTITESSDGFPVMEWCGNETQEIAITGSIQNSISVRINNPEGVKLLAPLELPFKLELEQGKIISSAENMLTLLPDCTVQADSLSRSSFVDGPIRKQGLLAAPHFLFPVGKDQLRWLALKNATGDFTVAYVKGNAWQPGHMLDTGIHQISQIEYWTIATETPGNASAGIELSFDDPNGGGVTELASLRVAQLVDNTWINRGNAGITGSAGASGSVWSDVVQNFTSAMQRFTLAAGSDAGNPLPIKLQQFSAYVYQQQTRLEWTCEDVQGVRFEVQRAGEQKDFETIMMIDGDENRQHYSFIDKKVGEGKWYYRLRMTERSGAVAHSKIVPVYIRSRPFRLLHARTMQDRGVLQLEVFSPLPDRVIWLITDIGGRVLQTSMQAVEKGVNTIMVHVTSLPPGLYFIAGKSTGNRSNMLPFLKN
jgi:hypothetical protein